MTPDKSSLLKNTARSYYAWLSIASVVVTGVLLPKAWIPYAVTVAAVLLLFAVVQGARQIIATKNEELIGRQAKWETERNKLDAELTEARRDGWDAETTRRVTEFLANLTDSLQCANDLR